MYLFHVDKPAATSTPKKHFWADLTQYIRRRKTVCKENEKEKEMLGKFNIMSSFAKTPLFLFISSSI